MKDRLILEAILFVVTFVIVYTIYEFANKKKKRKKNKEPIEIVLLRNYFKVDISKLNYKKLINSISIISAFDVSLIVAICCISNIGLVRIIVAIIAVIPVIFLSYYLFAKYCKKKISKKEGK